MVRQPPFPARPGLTLVELLVVVTIMVLLVGVVLPLARPALKGRETREAARQVNTFLAGAAARAMATGRPTGVQFIRPSGTKRCFSLVTVKERPPFTGGSPESQVQVTTSGRLIWSDSNNMAIAKQLRLSSNDAFRIKLDYRGHTYDGVYDVNDGFQVVSDKPLPQGVPDRLFAYQMFLPPRRSAAAPLELPLGAYIDLESSGFGQDRIILPPGVVNEPYPRMILMFHPNGSLDRFYGWIDLPPGSENPDHWGSWSPTEDLALLVARGKDREDDATPNLSPEAGSLWVTVNHRTGHARTTENLGSRQSAFSGPNMGGH